MVKKIIGLFLVLITAPVLKADWLDDMAQLTHKGLITGEYELNVPKAQSLIEKCVKDDKAEIERLEKLMALNDKADGIMSAGHSISYKAQKATAKTQLSYHKKIANSLKELPENKRDRETIIKYLASLKEAQDELNTLKVEMSKATGSGKKIKIGAQIAAQEIKIQGKKAYIKGTLLV